MKYIKNSWLIITLTLFTLGTTTSVAIEAVSFVGADVEWTNLRAKNDWNKVLPSTYYGGNFYVGRRFLENLGLEFGYTFTGTQTKTHTFPAGDTFFGSPVGGTTVKYQVGFNGWHLDLLGYLPIGNCSDVMASVGFGSLKPRLKNATSNLKLDGLHKGVMRVGIGIQYMATDFVGVRVFIRSIRTSTLRIASYNPNVPIKAFHDAYSVALGFFFNF